MKTTSKMNTTLKMKETLKIGLHPQIILSPLKITWNFFDDLLPWQLHDNWYQTGYVSGVQTGNGIPHDRFNIRGIAHVRTNRKGDIFVQTRLGQIFIFILKWGKGHVKNQDRTRPELTQP